jgi:hypothetical protein
MTAITVGSVTATGSAKAGAASKGLLARLWAAFIAARMRQAEREILLHSHLLPTEFRLASERLTERTEKDLPFIRKARAAS